jgi:2'-5' RNA ligase
MKLILGIDAQSLNLDDEQLKKLKVGLNKRNFEYRFIPRDQYHITLVNFGDIDESQYIERDGYIKNIIQEHPTFDLKLTGIWAYPNQIEARLLWVGVQNSKELRSLQTGVSALIPSICELDFKPILPILRLRNHHNVTDIISPYKGKDLGKLQVKSIVLYEMISGGAYPTYKEIRRYYLADSLEEGMMFGLGM